jgi:hypothetical protein
MLVNRKTSAAPAPASNAAAPLRRPLVDKNPKPAVVKTDTQRSSGQQQSGDNSSASSSPLRRATSAISRPPRATAGQKDIAPRPVHPPDASESRRPEPASVLPKAALEQDATAAKMQELASKVSEDRRIANDVGDLAPSLQSKDKTQAIDAFVTLSGLLNSRELDAQHMSVKDLVTLHVSIPHKESLRETEKLAKADAEAKAQAAALAHGADEENAGAQAERAGESVALTTVARANIAAIDKAFDKRVHDADETEIKSLAKALCTTTNPEDRKLLARAIPSMSSGARARLFVAISRQFPNELNNRDDPIIAEAMKFGANLETFEVLDRHFDGLGPTAQNIVKQWLVAGGNALQMQLMKESLATLVKALKAPDPKAGTVSDTVEAARRMRAAICNRHGNPHQVMPFEDLMRATLTRYHKNDDMALRHVLAGKSPLILGQKAQLVDKKNEVSAAANRWILGWNEAKDQETRNLQLVSRALRPRKPA